MRTHALWITITAPWTARPPPPHMLNLNFWMYWNFWNCFDNLSFGINETFFSFTSSSNDAGWPAVQIMCNNLYVCIHGKVFLSSFNLFCACLSWVATVVPYMYIMCYYLCVVIYVFPYMYIMCYYLCVVIYVLFHYLCYFTFHSFNYVPCYSMYVRSFISIFFLKGIKIHCSLLIHYLY